MPIMLKLKVRGPLAMKLEALALALLTQTLQVGLRPKPEPVWYPPAPSDFKSEAHCHCLCQCGAESHLVSGGALGGLIGFGGASLCFTWCGSRRSGDLNPSPRRKGHGVISSSPAWADLGGVLRG